MRKTISNILCFTTLGVLFLMLFQGEAHLFNLKQLEGVIYEVKKPQLKFDNFYNNRYQASLEKYLRNNFGFREMAIRLFNQYLWDFYHKSYSEEVAIGKDNWLYFNFNVNVYYGKDTFDWVDKNEAEKNLDRKMLVLNKLRGVLKDYGIEMMYFISPDKADMYPQYLPERDFDTTAFHACDFFKKEFEKYDFPYIDINAWFKKVQDTLDFPAIPQASAHWVFPAVYAADTVFRFMADQKNIVMPKIHIGGKKENSAKTKHVIRDLEYGLNLMRPIKLSDYKYYEREVTVAADSNAVKMNAIFVGNSFFRAFNQYIPLSDIFNDVRYWFYNKTEYSGRDADLNFSRSRMVADVDRLYEILNSDYIVCFTDNAQLYKLSYQFAEDALIQLCVSDGLWNAETERIMHENNITRQEAEQLLRFNPLLIKGLDNDSIPLIRNEKGIADARNKYLLFEKIKNNYLEDNDIDVLSIVNEILSSKKFMGMIEEKAKERNQTIEETIIQDAQWIVNQTRKNNENKD